MKNKDTVSRFVQDTNFDDEDDDIDIDSSSSSENQNSFQDFKLRLGCCGDCGSKIMSYFLNETNLKLLQTNPPPRFQDILFGKAPKKYFQKFRFDCQEKEDIFRKLFIADLNSKAKSAVPMGRDIAVETNKRNIIKSQVYSHCFQVQFLSEHRVI